MTNFKQVKNSEIATAMTILYHRKQEGAGSQAQLMEGCVNIDLN